LSKEFLDKTMKQSSNQQTFSRRNLLQFGAGLVGTGTLTAWLGTGALAQTVERRTALAQQSPSRPDGLVARAEAVTGDQALVQLMEGNQRFMAAKRLSPHQDMVRVAEVATGQAPFAAILSCADSRVVPEIAFDQGIGDLFVVRVAGNLATTEDIASDEFAVGVLGVPLIMVLGHERCGAVDAAIKGGELPGVIESLVFAIQPAVQTAVGEPGDQLTNVIKANVRLQVQRLQASSVIAAAVKAGKLKIVGAYYDLDTGEVSLVS
jgi:carbonic anhydrase